MPANEDTAKGRIRPIIEHVIARLLRSIPFALRLLLQSLVCVSLCGLLGSSSCYYRVDDDDDYCDDDDFDDDDSGDDDDESCNDDDGFHLSKGQDRGSYRLEVFDVEPAVELGAHPVALVHGVSELSIFDLFGPGEYGAEDFHSFADRVLLANDDLLGLPASAGRRAYSGTLFTGNAIVVGYVQEVRDQDGWSPIPGKGSKVVFDELGELVSIENDVLVTP